MICHPTIDGTNSKPKKAPAPGYGVYSAHPMDELPKEYMDGSSRLMVIDMNGKRKDFQLAFYDFDNKVWQFMEPDTSLFEPAHAKWMDILPFADRD